MATRFYISSNSGAKQVPAISPAASSSWAETASMVRRRAIRFVDKSAAATISSTSTATSPELHATVQAISDPLAAQTISGTIAGQFLCIESASAGTGFVAIGARVLSQDGTTVRGTLLTVTGGALDYATSLTNRSLTGASSSNPITISSVSAQAGDRLVFEVGTNDNDVGTSRTYGVSIGAPTSSADLPVDSTTTTVLNGWIELSGNLTFQGLLGQPIFPTGVEQYDAGDIIASGFDPGYRPA